MRFHVSRRSATSRLIACGAQLALINLTALAFTVDKWKGFNRPSVDVQLPTEALTEQASSILYKDVSFEVYKRGDFSCLSGALL